jgi:hypothetical protein
MQIGTEHLLENVMENGHLGHLVVHGRTILKCILQKRMELKLHLSGAEYEPVAGYCERCNETSGFRKFGIFLGQLVYY